MADIAGAFADLRRHPDLLWQFTKRQVAVRVKGSFLGAFWLVITPLLGLALYTFVFGIIFGGRFGFGENESTMDYALGIFVGLALHGFLAEILTMGPMMMLMQTNLVKKVVFPLVLLPVAGTAAALLTMLVSFALAAIGMLAYGTGLTPLALWLPVIVLPLMLFGLGLAWLLAALGVYLRDLNHVMAFISLAALYGSAVFYSVRMVPDAAWAVLRFNPLLHAIELSRGVLFWGEAPDLASLGFLWLSGVGMAVLGLVVFQRLKGGFADVM